MRNCFCLISTTPLRPQPSSESILLSYQNKGFFEYLDAGKHPLANCVCDRKENISNYVSVWVCLRELQPLLPFVLNCTPCQHSSHWKRFCFFIMRHFHQWSLLVPITIYVFEVLMLYLLLWMIFPLTHTSDHSDLLVYAAEWWADLFLNVCEYLWCVACVFAHAAVGCHYSEKLCTLIQLKLWKFMAANANAFGQKQQK